MPWYNGDYPPSYKNQPEEIKEKAVEIANALLLEGAEEGIAIATGLKQARELLKNHSEKNNQKIIIMKDDKQQSVKKSLKDYDPKENKSNKNKKNSEGKTIEEATDPSKLSKL
ncbi:hypothetical protein [Flavobacterium limi]|uniref:DUF2188 domain-containing protein n=1 Tax=Flavobacterium limi TaxID=2045105 RepID=A0ABQ1UM16_9FLAO|nr:hypothetical protein [Flavobacterium limi]GGF22312.1 hypothetical protein GCM10011518_34380 [Flavobacterium limi]